MEKDQKRTIVACSIVSVALVVLVVLSLLAPRGEDFPRSQGAKVQEGNLSEDRDGVYSFAETEDECVVVGKDKESTEWKFTVKEDGSYYLGAGYMPLEGNGQELEFSLLLDGKKVADRKSTRLNSSHS